MKKFSEQYIKNIYSIKNDCKEDFQCKCLICNKTLKSVAAFTTHVLRYHKISLDNYIFKYMTNLTLDFKYEKCGFCNNDALPTILYNFKNNTYKLVYDEGYMCKQPDCINNICLQFFNLPYSESKSKYEHIGANSKFLSIRYKISIEEVKTNIKHNKDFEFKPEQKTDLNGYILRYGKKEGTKLYNQRCNKIAQSNTVEWYIDRYGEEDGTKKYIDKFEKIFHSTSNISHSKHQYDIYNALYANDNNWQDERFVGGSGVADMVNKSLRLAIEYFGDYWHANPKIYKDDFYNKSLKQTAKQIQEDNLVRLNRMLKFSKEIDYIIVVWEKSFYEKGLNAIIEEINNSINNHIVGKKEIIWI